MKNIHVFSAELPTLAELEEKLAIEENQGVLFAPLLENQPAKFGFNPEYPLEKLSNGYKLNFVYSWKRLPKLAISEEAERRLELIMLEEPGIAQEILDELKEETFEAVLAEYCGKVLPDTISFSAYYHTKDKKLIVDSKQDLSSRAISLLIQLVGSVETKTLHCSDISNSVTTNLLASLNNEEERLEGISFAGFAFGDLLVLQNTEKTIARFKGDYPLDHIKELLEEGYKVKQVNLSKDGISFTLNDKFKIKQINSAFELEDDESQNVEEYALHHQAVELELMVSHCNTLRDFFDKQLENNSTPPPANDSPNKEESDTQVEDDFLLEEAKAFVIETRRVSISSIQRKFRIGYNRAARIVEQLENNDIVSEPGHNGSREVLKAA